jgi:hypothetical protein
MTTVASLVSLSYISLSFGAVPGQPTSGIEAPPAQEGTLRGVSISLGLYGLRRPEGSRALWPGRHAWDAAGIEIGHDLARLGASTRLALSLAWISDTQASEVESFGRAPQASSAPTAPFAGLGGELERDALQLGATLRWRADRALQPYLGLALGGTRGELMLDPWSGRALRSTAYGLLGRASLGLRLQPRALTARRPDGRAVLGVALTGEVGAFAGTPLSFTMRPRPISGTPVDTGDTIAVEPVRLGELGQTAAYARLAFLLLF